MMLLKALALSSWLYAGTGITQGISGLALYKFVPDNATLLAVRDNKKEGESRLAMVSLRRGFGAMVQEIGWPDEKNLPIDLEAISDIPDRGDEFVAMTSAGKCYRMSLGEPGAKVEDMFDLPAIPDKANFEGMSIAQVGSELLIVWGDRGELPRRARIFWTTFDKASLRPVGAPKSADLDIPWPAATGSRGISDLKLDPSGALFATAAADFGDDGPFQSGLFMVGTLNGEFRPALMTRLAWFEGKKIEALEFIPGKNGGMIFGTDDENLGGSIWQNLWPTD